MWERLRWPLTIHPTSWSTLFCFSELSLHLLAQLLSSSYTSLMTFSQRACGTWLLHFFSGHDAWRNYSQKTCSKACNNLKEKPMISLLFCLIQNYKYKANWNFWLHASSRYIWPIVLCYFSHVQIQCLLLILVTENMHLSSTF